MSLSRDIPAELAAALRERISIVADAESRRDQQRHMERLRDVSERIVALAAQLPVPVDPQLKHYLERCSYTKALDVLETKQA
jgi:hypothetical protein